jgi:hypothetical protein
MGPSVIKGARRRNDAEMIQIYYCKCAHVNAACPLETRDAAVCGVCSLRVLDPREEQEKRLLRLFERTWDFVS